MSQGAHLEPIRTAIILAAGKGTRFRSQLPKVLHKLCGRPMIEHLLDRVQSLGVNRTLIVVGHEADQIKDALAGREGIEFVTQEPQLGTGHAVQMTAATLANSKGSVLVVYSDTPRITPATLESLFKRQAETHSDQVLLTCELEKPTGYGRIVRDSGGHVAKIVEEKDATPEIREIREVNPGFYVFKIESLLSGLEQLSSDNAQSEFYLTDLVEIFREKGQSVETVQTRNADETVGVNDRVALSEADAALRQEINRQHMMAGVTMVRPETITIDAGVVIGTDTILLPGTTLEGRTRIGRGCRIGPWSLLKHARLGDNVKVDSSCVIRNSEVGDGTTVGPFAHLRQKALVGRSARVGNFVEIKKSKLADGAKSAHLAYLGDADIGERVNIGAGVITCNYDGVQKHKTTIEKDAFIGSDSQLVAPVKVGQGAYVASGSTITDDVPPDALAIARSRQTLKPEWAKKLREKKKRK